MNELSPELAEKARKIETAVLRSLATRTQTSIAHACSMSDTAMSRFVNGGDLHRVCLILAAADIEVLGADDVAVPRHKLKALKVLAIEALAEELR